MGLVLLGLAGAVPAEAQARGTWAPEERVVLSDFSRVAAVASDGRRVHAATSHGLIGYDAERRRWEAPLTWEDGYPVPEEPSALAWLRSEQVLVLGTRLGRLWRIDPFTSRIEPIAATPGPVEQLLPGATGELYIRTGAGWLELTPGDFVARAIPGPPPVPRAPADLRLQALRGTLGRDAQLRRWRLTDVAPGAHPDEFFIGTDGGGLVHVDARALATTPLPYGPGTRAVTALAGHAGRLWFGGDGALPGRATVAAADPGLAEWQWHDRTAGAPGEMVSALASTGRQLWAGTPAGLYRLAAEGTRWERFDQREHLPANRVTALATLDSALWVGTDRGACLWQEGACGPTLLAGETVTALQYCAGALWIGTERGLWRATGQELARDEPAALAGTPIGGLACRAGELQLAAGNLLVSRGDSSWREPVPLPSGGQVYTLVAGDSGVWVGTAEGAAHYDPARRAWSRYVVPQDVPFGPVLAVLPLGPHVWLATPGGAVRLDTRHR